MELVKLLLLFFLDFLGQIVIINYDVLARLIFELWATGVGCFLVVDLFGVGQLVLVLDVVFVGHNEKHRVTIDTPQIHKVAIFGNVLVVTDQRLFRLFNGISIKAFNDLLIIGMKISILDFTA